MPPLFIRRVETVVSLQQLEGVVPAGDGDGCCGCAGSGSELPGDAPVSAIACSRLPKYSFACDAAPRPGMSRLNSAADLTALNTTSSAGGLLQAAFNKVQQQETTDDTASSEGGGPCGSGGSASAADTCVGGGGGLRSASTNTTTTAIAATTAAAAARAPAAAHTAAAASLELDLVEGGSSCEGSVVDDVGCVPSRSLLDSVLLASWEECAEQGLFRYDVTACPTKVVPGAYGFVAQLNTGRYSKKRPTEFRVDQVVQAFDASKFNFTKALRREVLFAFEPATSTKSSSSSSRYEDSGRAGPSPSLVFINVSPIDYGHVLLVPRVLDCLPQNLDPAVTRLALHFALEVGNPYCRVGFNSLGGFATINHLHFQAYYLAAPLPCERAPTRPLPGVLGGAGSGGGRASLEVGGGAKGRGGGGGGGGDDASSDSAYHPVAISALADYPVRGWVVEGPSLAGMAQVVGEASLALQAANIPHNVLIADCGGRVFIWPQAYAERQARGLVPEHLLDIGVNPAVWEISGHMVLKRDEDYANFTEGAAWELLAAVSLSEDDFVALGRQLWGGAGQEAVGTGLSVGGAAQAARAAAAESDAEGGPEPMAGVVLEAAAVACRN